MKTKIAKGNTRKLLIVIGKLQTLIGQAKNNHENDRNPNGFEKGQKALDEAFRLCLQARSEYDPVEDS